MVQGSKIFAGYRAIGFVSNHIPLCTRYVRRNNESLIITCVGKSFHMYASNRFGLFGVGKVHPENITALTVGSEIFTACGNTIFAWDRYLQLKHTYTGHEKSVHLLLQFAHHLLSVDEESNVRIWEVSTEELYTEISFNNDNFKVTTMMHPSALLNKILLGSEQGQLQLWNIKTKTPIYKFDGWNSPVRTVVQAPAVHVVGIGLLNGDIILHNIVHDMTVVKFHQDWGPVTSITFRTDGPPFMVTGSAKGHLAVWNLEERKLENNMYKAHGKAVTGLTCLPNEPLFVTSSPDNTLKMWIFDMADGSARLLRQLEGHQAPPSRIRFYGSDGHYIVSAGFDSSVRLFSTLAERFNRSLGRASYNRKASKKVKKVMDRLVMPPIVDFAAETAREKDWDNIVGVHQGSSTVTTWSYDKKKMGDLKFKHPRFTDPSRKSVIATSVCITSCGNFVIIGYSSGHVDRYNLQSGIHRATYGDRVAHTSAVRGVATDILNQFVVTGGSDTRLKFWHFKSGTLLSELSLPSPISFMLLQRESNMLAVATDNFMVHVVDVGSQTRQIVREFSGHAHSISDMVFSIDSRWLVTASLDSTIRTWDMLSGCLLDCVELDRACTSLTMSPTGEFLATSHVDDLGIYLWSNCTLYSHVSLVPLPDDYEPSIVELPSTSLGATDVPDVQVNIQEETDGEYKSPEQIADELVTLSLLPNSRWQNLLNLDEIKRRNKPKNPVTVPKDAPFFIPTVAGLEVKFDLPEPEKDKDKNSRILVRKDFRQYTQFSRALEEALTTEQYTKAFDLICQMGPSSVEIEIHSLSPDSGGSLELLQQFLKMINIILLSNKNFEVANAQLALFLKIHGETVASNEELRTYITVLHDTVSTSWSKVHEKLNFGLCLVSFLKNSAIYY